MPNVLKHRRHRFDALHALLTGSFRRPVPRNLRHDLGLPAAPERAAGLLAGPFGLSGHRRD